MRGLHVLLAVLSLLSALCAGDAVGDLQTKGIPVIDAAIANSTTCTKDKVKVRKEWYILFWIQRCQRIEQDPNKVLVRSFGPHTNVRSFETTRTGASSNSPTNVRPNVRIKLS
ncbi:hypothetical protein BU23DRAFT_555139 [Bimuria novae-zelandiae CBS 107.79]|uniref:Uncharacterized protein n=1 Tax=Bimuria novae-zelandiae CBS 107.79 TaxID=1447943 RepID=A0A6A5V8H8_9PLEO|nr:hypothetical protein BU23DRAFT_555139 [Bimuria novae-zelandiae CBS 107.79]